MRPNQIMGALSFSPVVIVLVVVASSIAFALWRIGPRRGLENFGRTILRASGGRPEVADQASKSKAVGVGAATLIALLLIFVLLASRA